MEVASPLPFSHSQAGNKRRFACSPIVDATAMAGIDASSSDDYAMDDSSGYGHSFKRRRFGSSENMDMNQPSQLSSILPSTTASFVTIPFGTAGHVSNRTAVSLSTSASKRYRSEDSTTTNSSSNEKLLLQQTVARQTADIERLTSEKSNVLSSYVELKTTHDRTVSENKILKRAVTIQQERQNQAATELDVARKYKGDAEDKMRKLEQIILSLRYHLQAQQPCNGNDFMGLSQRPPDVY